MSHDRWLRTLRRDGFSRLTDTVPRPTFCTSLRYGSCCLHCGYRFALPRN